MKQGPSHPIDEDVSMRTPAGRKGTRERAAGRGRSWGGGVLIEFGTKSIAVSGEIL